MDAKNMKTALTIAGSDSSGGAGIQADIKTMITNGVYAMSAITALTAQNTTGVSGIFDVTPEFLAAQLDATNIEILPMNKRGKKAKKVKDVVKFKIDFTIVKNITAETGERTLYVRITKPDNDVLTKSASNTFSYENRQLAYSIKKYIEYNGEEQNVTVYWNVEEYLYAGAYRVDIFADGTLIGSQGFTMD